eukprot:291428-Prorocentrum_minimum.AAC.1
MCEAPPFSSPGPALNEGLMSALSPTGEEHERAGEEAEGGGGQVLGAQEGKRLPRRLPRHALLKSLLRPGEGQRGRRGAQRGKGEQ